MEFERTVYIVREKAGQVQLCVAITSRHSYCPVGYDFSLILGADGEDGGASKSFNYANMSVLGINEEDQLSSGSCSTVPSVLDFES